MVKIKLQIKNRWTGSILFEYEKENNTMKDTVIEAVKNNTYLRGAYLRDADLGGAYLRGADLGGADLRDADLRGAYLRDADLRDAKNIPLIPLACPTDGAFIGWKKARHKGGNPYLIKLEIPEDAKRSSATTNKCRCDKAKVLGIYNLDGTPAAVTEVLNTNEKETLYKVGEIVLPDSFDENRFNECSHGIHFFIDKQSAIDY